jgi:hypothetical protein
MKVWVCRCGQDKIAAEHTIDIHDDDRGPMTNEGFASNSRTMGPKALPRPGNTPPMRRPAVQPAVTCRSRRPGMPTKKSLTEGNEHPPLSHREIHTRILTTSSNSCR